MFVDDAHDVREEGNTSRPVLFGKKREECIVNTGRVSPHDKEIELSLALMNHDLMVLFLIQVKRLFVFSSQAKNQILPFNFSSGYFCISFLLRLDGIWLYGGGLGGSMPPRPTP